MNEGVNNILSRRSIRSFKSDKVLKSDLEIIMECAVNAPSARNTQKWKFTVIQNPEILNKLVKAMGNARNDPNYGIYNANVLILASNERDYKFAAEDCSCALENIFLAANALGLGSVWINKLQDNCDIPEIRKILDEAKVPANHIVIGSAAIGYINTPANKIAKRKDAVEWIL